MGRRRLVQIVWTFLTNLNIPGFFTGKIYSGNLKRVCVPGLNCYSCPGALGSCPIGALQAVLSKSGKYISYFVLGFFLFVGGIFGRFICGYLCPFGLIQELLNKIPFVKKIGTFKGDRALRKFKYAVLLVFVILMPLFLTDIIGQGAPYFCKLICPVGTLEGGVFLMISNPSLRSAIGTLYAWKMAILLVTLFMCVIIYRPFCKYICPLGAVYSFFNKVAIFRYHLDNELCISCDNCKKACPMNIHPAKEINHCECIRCGACKKACDQKAIT